MSDYLEARIRKPKRFRLTPLHRGRSKSRTPIVIGFDTESEKARPFLLQFSFPDEPIENTLLVPVSARGKHAALRLFLRVLHEHCWKRKFEYLVYGFHLAYEWTQLFGDFD